MNTTLLQQSAMQLGSTIETKLRTDTIANFFSVTYGSGAIFKRLSFAMILLFFLKIAGTSFNIMSLSGIASRFRGKHRSTVDQVIKDNKF